MNPFVMMIHPVSFYKRMPEKLFLKLICYVLQYILIVKKCTQCLQQFSHINRFCKVSVHFRFKGSIFIFSESIR